MSWTPIVLIELVLIGGCAIGWGWWELRGLRRERERRERAAAEAVRTDAAS